MTYCGIANPFCGWQGPKQSVPALSNWGALNWLQQLCGIPPGLLLKSSRGRSSAWMLGAFDEKALYPGTDAGVLAAGQFFCQMLGSYCFWTATSLCCGWPAHLSVFEELIISHSEAELARTIPKKTDGDNPGCNRDFLPCCSSLYMRVSCWALFTWVVYRCVCSRCLDFALLCLEVGSKVFEGL